MSAAGQMTAWANDLRGVRAIATDAAREAAPLVEKEVKRTAAAGTSPSGEAWKATKAGARPMANAAEHVRVTQSGPTLRIVLEGPDAFHQFGSSRLPKRPVIPDPNSEMPEAIAAACDEGVKRALEKAGL